MKTKSEIISSIVEIINENGGAVHIPKAKQPTIAFNDSTYRVCSVTAQKVYLEHTRLGSGTGLELVSLYPQQLEKIYHTIHVVNQNFLLSRGFVQDRTCPVGVNRLEKQVGDGFDKQYWVSVTLSQDGSRTLYGVINFHNVDIYGASRPYDYILEHRSFDGPINVNDFERFCDKQSGFARRTVYTT